MKIQWSMLLAIIFAVIVAVFAVINVDAVEVNYLFGTAQWPLILVILCSVLMGALIIGFGGLVRIYKLQRQVKGLEREKAELEAEVAQQNNHTRDKHKVQEASTVSLVDDERN
ncbi:DUF1049 domain-containing protein [Bacillus tianshenii]|nr:DUF1049 domain-containing protein [Bacillus tianshenii]